jgi:ParB-like chromosome segregation protein Spo0J
MLEIRSKDIKLVDVDSIIPNPKNANRHSIEQIKRLEKLIKYQGFRNPLIISNRTGFLIAGHGRLEAAKNLGIDKLPVIYQDFENEAQEYAYLVSDNEIARWAELDKQAVHIELLELDLDVELLGIEKFDLLDAEEIDLPDLGDGSDSMIKQMTFTVSTEQADIIEDAIDKVKKESECYDEINENSNGNALAEIMRRYVNS